LKFSPSYCCNARNENFGLVLVKGPFTLILQTAAKASPFYLQAWRSDFIPRSRAVLSALHDVSRRLASDCPATQDTIQCPRNGLVVVFCTPRKMTYQKADRQSSSPFFKEYQQEMQGLALVLLVMLQAPSERPQAD
jgi:hypothetical protein